MRTGLDYQFKLNDLAKYSQKLKFQDIASKFKRSALGKVIPDENERRKRLANISALNKLLKILQYTDWSKTPVYRQFIRNGRWKHEDPKLYSDQELKLLTTSLKAMLNGNNDEEFIEKEGQVILKKHTSKTLHTLEVLMNQMNMMYYWEKIRLHFLNKTPTLD